MQYIIEGAAVASVPVTVHWKPSYKSYTFVSSVLVSHVLFSKEVNDVVDSDPLMANTGLSSGLFWSSFSSDGVRICQPLLPGRTLFPLDPEPPEPSRLEGRLEVSGATLDDRKRGLALAFPPEDLRSLLLFVLTSATIAGLSIPLGGDRLPLLDNNGPFVWVRSVSPMMSARWLRALALTRSRSRSQASCVMADIRFSSMVSFTGSCGGRDEGSGRGTLSSSSCPCSVWKSGPLV